MTMNHSLAFFWNVYIILGIVPGFIKAKEFLKEWRNSDDKLNLQTQGSWKVDILVFLMAFMISDLLWFIVCTEWLALHLKNKWYNRTNKRSK